MHLAGWEREFFIVFLSDFNMQNVEMIREWERDWDMSREGKKTSNRHRQKQEDYEAIK